MAPELASALPAPVLPSVASANDLVVTVAEPVEFVEVVELLVVLEVFVVVVVEVELVVEVEVVVVLEVFVAVEVELVVEVELEAEVVELHTQPQAPVLILEHVAFIGATHFPVLEL